MSNKIRVTVIDVNFVTLGVLVEVRAGYPFRGAIEPVPDGDVTVVQMKNLSPEGSVDWTGATRTRLSGRKKPDWLLAGDLLLVTRGTRYYAAALENAPATAVCGPHLYQLRPKSGAVVLPEFLAWQLNQGPLQSQLRKAAEGSNQLSVRRPEVEALPIALPALPEQKRVVRLARSAARERAVLDELILNRERQLRALAYALSEAAEKS